MRGGLDFLRDEPEFTLLRRRRVLVVGFRWVRVLLLLRRVLLVLVRRLLPLVELLVVVLLLLLLLLRRELLPVVVSLSSSESLPFLGMDLVINRLALIGCALMVAFLPVNLGRSGNFSTGIPLVASFMNCRQV